MEGTQLSTYFDYNVVDDIYSSKKICCVNEYDLTLPINTWRIRSRA